MLSNQFKIHCNRKTAILYLLFFCLLWFFPTASNAGEIPSEHDFLQQRNNTFVLCTDDCQSLPLFSTDPVSVYYSSNPYVLSVGGNGILTAHHTGTAQIIYTSMGRLFCYNVQVFEKGSRSSHSEFSSQKEIFFTLKDSVLFMEPGDSYKVEITGKSGSLVSPYSGFSWSSEDTGVARVNSFGKITAGKKGSTAITCRLGNQSAKVYVNVISNDYGGKACDFSILTAEGEKRTYRLFKQNANNYPNYNRYITWHGCATCSLASVLGAYNNRYSGILPSEVIDGPEKSTVPNSDWNREHVERSLRKQMPLSLYGISSILSKYEVSNEYVRTYEEEEAREDIFSHLKTGNPIIFEVGQKNNITGKRSKRWTNSYHTMVFLGALTNGKVLLYDAIDRSWYKGGNRVKIIELDDVMRFMFPCTKFSESMYYNGAKSDGGYIKIYD